MGTVTFVIILLSCLISIDCNSIFIENVPQSYCIIYYGNRQVLISNDSRINFQQKPNQNEKIITLVTLNGHNITFKSSQDTPSISNHPGCNYGLVLYNDNIPAIANVDKKHGCDIFNINYITNEENETKKSTDGNIYIPNKNSQISINTNAYILQNRNDTSSKTNQNSKTSNINQKTQTQIWSYQIPTYQRPKVVYNSSQDGIKTNIKSNTVNPIFDDGSYHGRQAQKTKCTTSCTYEYEKENPSKTNKERFNPSYITDATFNTHQNRDYMPIYEQNRDSFPNRDFNPGYNVNYNNNQNKQQIDINDYQRITQVRDNSIIVYTFVNKGTKPLYPAFSINTTHNYILDSVLGFLMPNQVRLYSFDGYWKALVINPNSSIQCGFYDPFEFVFTDCDRNVKRINKNRIYIMTKERSCLVKEN
jgi:hypothetical protein